MRIKRFFSAGSLLGIALFAATGCGPPTPPSDASLIARFNAHRADFDRILAMLDQDRIDGDLRCSETSDPSRGPDYLAPQRRVEYVRLFKAIGCEGSVYYSPRTNMKANFRMWSDGMLWAGQDKSIALFPDTEPEHVVETTDGYRWTKADRERGLVDLYRHIDGPWYLHYLAT